MTSLIKSARLLVLICPFLLAPVFADETGTDGEGTANRTDDFRLKGVLVSHSGRSALINDRIVQEGDRVNGVEILSITEGTVQILMGSRELEVRVGAELGWDQMVSMSSPQRLADSTGGHSGSAEKYGPVRRGETLSQIAERHLQGSGTTNQMMIALFQTNPQAFGGNINFLREGAVLQIPSRDALHQRTPNTATAEVARQVDAWRTNHTQQIQVSIKGGVRSIGPVMEGESLSEISVRVPRDGATVNQTMIAFFEANPHAFDGNINILHEGVVLRVPDTAALHRQTNEMATAEVVRQIEAWRNELVEQRQLARAIVDVGDTAT